MASSEDARGPESPAAGEEAKAAPAQGGATEDSLPAALEERGGSDAGNSVPEAEDGRRRSRERRVPRERDESNLYVGYIPTCMSGDDVTILFESTLGVKGAVQETSLIYDRVTREPKGYGFVKMWDARLAAEAVRRLHGFTIDGKRLAVRVARDPPARATRGSAAREGTPAAQLAGGPPVQGAGAPPLPFNMGPPPTPHPPPMWVNPYQYSPYWGAPEGWYPHYHPAFQHSAYQHAHVEGVPVAANGFPETALMGSGQLPAAAVGHRPGSA